MDYGWSPKSSGEFDMSLSLKARGYPTSARVVSSACGKVLACGTCFLLMLQGHFEYERKPHSSPSVKQGTPNGRRMQWIEADKNAHLRGDNVRSAVRPKYNKSLGRMCTIRKRQRCSYRLICCRRGFAQHGVQLVWTDPWIHSFLRFRQRLLSNI